MGMSKEGYDYYQSAEDSEWSLPSPDAGVRSEDYFEHEVLSDEDGERREELDLLFVDELMLYLDDSAHWAVEAQ